MRVLVKRILRKYGYPPDLQDVAVQTVFVADMVESGIDTTLTVGIDSLIS